MGGGISLPEINCTRAPGLQLSQEAGRLCLPFPAAPALPGENQVSPAGRETELAARGQRLFSRRGNMWRKHAQPRHGAYPGPLTCCHGPARAAPASILTRWGWGTRLTAGPLPSSPVPSQVALTAQRGPGPQPLHSPHQCSACTHQMVRRARPWQSSSYPTFLPSQTHPNPLEKGVGQATARVAGTTPPFSRLP